MESWHEFVAELEKELGASVQKWMPKLSHFDAANIYLEPSDSFQSSWFEEHVRPRLKHFSNNNGRPVKVHIEVLKKKVYPSPNDNPLHLNPDSLDQELTFENFIPSDKNLVAYKLLLEKQSPFNPIYLYGPSGSGKTHLLTAFAHTQKKQGKKVFFVNAQTFTEHVVQAIRLGQMQLFRKVYRDIDVLIIDGIDIFSRKLATQEEFFHTFNTLHISGRLILLSATVAPTQLKEVEERLVSRFEWGISLGLNQTDKAQILQKKGELWNFPLKPEILTFLQTRFSNPIQALQALVLRAKNTLLTTQIAEKLLADLLTQESANALTSDEILKTVASHYGITTEDLLGKSQTREIAQPRQLAMYYHRTKLNLPYQAIGRLFGRDHSTVMSSIKQTQAAITEKKINEIEF